MGALEEGGCDAAVAQDVGPPPGVDRDHARALLSLVQSKRILISVGAGGVGKTTIAATLGLLGVGCGRRTLVMTIDPARRLAVSLGLDALGQKERQVPGDKLEAVGLKPGLLYASMLDQKETFDEVIRRHAPDSATAERILGNKLYHELSTRLAGGQEYAAMEKLHELVRSDAFDLLVLDTPPTANAFDFLEAPAKMVALLDSPAVRLFVKSYETAGKLSFKLLSFGSRYVFRRLARFVGGAFLDDVAEFFADMHSLLEGFGRRAAEVTKLLHGAEVGFVVVTTPDRRSTIQAQLFCDRLRADGLAVGAVVVNRVHQHKKLPFDVATAAARLRERGVEVAAASELAALLLENHARALALSESDAQLIGELARACGDELPYVQVPLLGDDVYDIGGLARLADLLR